MSGQADQAVAGGPGFEAAVRTHKGKVRRNNEDAFVFQPERGLFAVIDGMGGEAAGEVAASITRSALEAGDEPAESLLAANIAIRVRARRHPQEVGMGCVATAVVIAERGLELTHVGDTRAYLASEAGAEQLTRDHTVVAARQERAGLTDDEARALPDQHHITRDIGGEDRHDIDWIDQGIADYQPGDVLLLCSDGLHDLVPDSQLFRFLSKARAQSTAPRMLVDRLVQLALERGGTDNITVLAVRFSERPAPRRRPPSASPKKADIRKAILIGSGIGTLIGLAAGWLLGDMIVFPFEKKKEPPPPQETPAERGPAEPPPEEPAP